jgi:hypothetical protein
MQPCFADDASDQAIDLFEKRIRPVLVKECQRCHGEKKQQANLRIDSRDGWMKGGDTGPAIVAGETQSLLLKAIRYEDVDLEMPPDGKLPDEVIADFERWVALGAIDPRVASPPSASTEEVMPPTVEAGRSFWSFRPVIDPPVPEVRETAWPSTDIDRFVLAQLERGGLKHSPPADGTTLLRRVYYDLIGLPPTPLQVNEFLADPSEQAYESLVDRLLESEQFGQRWGRHWLDVVRYAESSGGGRTLLFPEAWRYRDYVIESLNSDLPYDQFVTQQIAGDLLPADDWQQRRRNLVATAFFLLGPTNYELQDKDVLEMDVIDEQLDTMGKALLGMTIGCARCHDHKFDPIPAADYYAMAGVLKSSMSLKHSNVSEWNKVKLPLSPDEAAKAKAISAKLEQARAELKSARKQWSRAGGVPETRQGQKSIDPKLIGADIVIDDDQAARIGTWTESTSVATFVGKHYLFDAGEARSESRIVYRPKLSESGQYEIRVSYTASSNRTTRAPFHVHHAGGTKTVRIDQRKKPSIGGQFVSLGVYEFDPISDPRIVVSCEDTDDGCVIADAVIFLASSDDPRQIADDARRRKDLSKRIELLENGVKELEKSLPKPPPAMAMADHESTGNIHLAIRGSTHQQGDLIPRGVLQVASWDVFPPIADGDSGRKQLAEWIVDRKNPLTARVIVNRVWYWLVGRGIVSSVDNFGAMGDLPSDPDLLDHLASSFVQDGWSIKKLIRRIVTSRTYQQSSKSNELMASIDPENRFQWRMNRKRLRAEDIRDSLLSIAGQLDLRHGGSNIKSGTDSEYGYRFTSLRRSVYVPVFRNTLPEIFEVFDFADPNIQRGKRSSSTVSSQALLMMNHPFVIAQARRAAQELEKLPDLEDSSRVDRAYLQVVGRPPTDLETQIALDLIADSDNNGSLDGPSKGLAMLYQVLFQCIDFRYLN